MVSRHFCLFFAVTLLASVVNYDPTLQQAETSNLSAPHSALLDTLQPKLAAVRSAGSDQNDNHPVDVHPAVESAPFTPDYMKVVRFSFVGKSNSETAKFGRQARAPPISIMSAKL